MKEDLFFSKVNSMINLQRHCENESKLFTLVTTMHVWQHVCQFCWWKFCRIPRDTGVYLCQSCDKLSSVECLSRLALSMVCVNINTKSERHCVRLVYWCDEIIDDSEVRWKQKLRENFPSEMCEKIATNEKLTIFILNVLRSYFNPFIREKRCEYVWPRPAAPAARYRHPQNSLSSLVQFFLFEFYSLRLCSRAANGFLFTNTFISFFASFILINDFSFALRQVAIGCVYTCLHIR